MRYFAQIRAISRILWVRALLIGALAIFTVIITPFIAPLVPENAAKLIDKDGVDRVLDSLATAMLTVTTFSVSVMVAVRNYATGRWTPRYLKLMSRDPVTQNVLASFIGAYIFALISIIFSNTSSLSRNEDFVLFTMTCLAISIVVVAIIRWVAHLQEVGSLSSTADHIQNYMEDLVSGPAGAPCWGAGNYQDRAVPGQPADVQLIAKKSGFVTFINIPNMQDECERLDGEIILRVNVGDFVRKGSSIGSVTKRELLEAAFKAISIDPSRTFAMDVRLCLISLTDIAIKSLSPSVNDPITAIEIVTRIDTLMEHMDIDEREATGSRRYSRIWIRPRISNELLVDTLEPIIYYGKDHPAVLNAVNETLRHHKKHGSKFIKEASKRLLKKHEKRLEGNSAHTG